MHIKHTSILAALLLASSFSASALNIGGNITPIPTNPGSANSFPVAKDDHISTVAGIYTIATGNVTSNDLYGSIATLEQSWVGKYGLITSFDSDGEYTYQLFASTTNASLPSGGVGYDRFTYTYANDTGLRDTAQLIIDVNADPNPVQSPIANNDHESVVISEKPSATGNVIDNDLFGTIVSFNQAAGEFGFLTITESSGRYVYKLFESTNNASLPPDGVATDSFTYILANKDGLTDSAQLIINVSANKTQPPIAKDDHGSVVINAKPSTVGNVSTNDLYGTIVSFDKASGQYGFLIVEDSSGGYIYRLFESTDNNSLPSGGIGVDSFTYTYANETGETDSAQLLIDVNADPAGRPIANNDHISTIVGVYTSATGNVTSNDLYGSIATLEQSWIGKYGLITSFATDGTYTYQLLDSTNNASLPDTGVGFENFIYTYANESGLTDTASLIIDVNANLDGPVARDDNATAIPNKIISVSDDLTINDSNGDYVQLTSTPSSEYGNLVLSPDSKGGYTYTIYETSPSIINLKTGEVVTDVFEYQYFADNGESSTAKLTVTIIGNQVDNDGNPIFGQLDETIYDNVDVEFNNRSADATPLNSNRNIQGHLYDSGDKDWFFLSSAGDEIITLEVCPQGTSCFGKKSWVLYVFDPDKLTNEQELRSFQFSRWVDETGTDKDLLGNIIISPNAGSSNHMYLAYDQGFFEGALIGIVDPCFDTLNAVDIGVPSGPRNYLIAISSPLEGGDENHQPSGKCGIGSVVLEQQENDAVGSEEGSLGIITQRPYKTTSQHVIAFPYSDDQYAIKITGTGLAPLNAEGAQARSASYNPATGRLRIPKIKVANQLYNADLEQDSRQERSTDSSFNFVLSAIEELTVDEVVDAYRATFSAETQKVLIPRVTDTSTGIGYSVVLQYHAANESTDFWFDVISIEEIK